MAELKAYIETTIVSYLTANVSRDVVIAAHQQITQEWWESAPGRFELVASQFVVNEASSGDHLAADKRLTALKPLSLLDASEQAERLAEALLRSGAVPEAAPEDAAHIAIATVNGVEYLVTWNCRHIANAALRSHIERVCREFGFEPPVICTPEELMEPE